MLWNPDKVFNNLHFHLLSHKDSRNSALRQLFNDNDLSQDFLQALEANALLTDREESISKMYLWLDKHLRKGSLKGSIIEVWRPLQPLLEELPETATADMSRFESMDALLVPLSEPIFDPPSSPGKSGRLDPATNDGLRALRETTGGKAVPPHSDAQAKIISYLVYEPEPLSSGDVSPGAIPQGTTPHPSPGGSPKANAVPASDPMRKTRPIPTGIRSLDDLAKLAPKDHLISPTPTNRKARQTPDERSPDSAIEPLPFIPPPSQARRAPTGSTNKAPTLHTKQRPGPRKHIYQTGNYPRIEKLDTGNHPLIPGSRPRPTMEQAVPVNARTHEWLTPQPMPAVQVEPQQMPPKRQPPTDERNPKPQRTQTKPNKPSRKPQPHKASQYPKSERIDAPAGSQHPLHALRKRRAQTNSRLQPELEAERPPQRQQRRPAHTLAPRQQPAQDPKAAPPRSNTRPQSVPRSNTRPQHAPRQAPKRPRMKAGLTPEEHRLESRSNLPQAHPIDAPTRAEVAFAEPVFAEPPQQPAEMAPTPDAPLTPPGRRHHISTGDHPAEPHDTHENQPYQTDDHYSYHNAKSDVTPTYNPAFDRTPSAEFPAAGTAPVAHPATIDVHSSQSAKGVLEISEEEFDRLDSRAELEQFLFAEAATPDSLSAVDAAEVSDEELPEGLRETIAAPVIPPPKAPQAASDILFDFDDFEIEDSEAEERSNEVIDDDELLFDEEVERISMESTSRPVSERMDTLPKRMQTIPDSMIQQLDNAPDFDGFGEVSDVGPAVHQPDITQEPALQTPLPRDTYVESYPLATPQPRMWLVILLTTIVVSALLVGGAYVSKRWLLTPEKTARKSPAGDRDPYPFQRAKIPVRQVLQKENLLVFVMQKRWRQHTNIQEIAQRLFAALSKQDTKTIRKIRLVDHKGKHLHWFKLDMSSQKRPVKRSAD